MGLAAAPGAATAGAAAAPVSAGVPAAGDTSGMAPFAAKRAVSRASEAVFFLHPPHTYRHLPTYCGALWGGQNRTYLPIAWGLTVGNRPPIWVGAGTQVTAKKRNRGLNVSAIYPLWP